MDIETAFDKAYRQWCLDSSPAERSNGAMRYFFEVGFKAAQQEASRDSELKPLLQSIRDYNDGKGKYNFSRMNDHDRSIASLEAWEAIREQIDKAMSEGED